MMNGRVEEGRGGMICEEMGVFKNSVVYFFKNDAVFLRFPWLRQSGIFAIVIINVFNEMTEELITLLH